MLDVSKEEFRRSRNRQEQAAIENKNDDSSRRMLLFYAVECGGKYQILKRENFKLFSALPSKYKGYKHDIRAILKEIGLEEKCSFPIVTSAHGENISADRYQEMWRYGINCDDSKTQGALIEAELVKALKLLHELESRR